MIRVCSLLLCSALLGSVTAQVADRPRPGPWPTASKVPAGWVVFNTKNYHVQSECGDEKAKRLGEHMEVMNVVYRKMFKPDKDGSKQQTIKLFKDRKTFQAYGAPPNAGAYYSYGDREMVCYDTGQWSDEEKKAAPVTGPSDPLERLRRVSSRLDEILKMDVLGCAAHEGWHQYYHFYTASPKRSGKQKAKGAELGAINNGRLWILKAAKAQDEMVRLTEFVRMLQQDYYSNPSICYAQGWAFCQFLLHGQGGKYEKLIPNYIRLVRDDTNWESVQAKVFKGIDFAVMETEFKAYIDSMKTTVDEAVDELADDMPKVPPGGGG
jgi:hypothetical protein